MTGASVRKRWGTGALEALAVIVVATLAAVATTWPLAAHLSTLAHDTADAPFQAWTIDHVQRALLGHGSLYDAGIFLPNRHTLAYSDTLIGLAVPLLPLRALGLGPLAQLNVALLAGMVTSAAAAYVLGLLVSGRRTVAALAGAAFAFGPAATPFTAHVHATTHAGVAAAAALAWWLADRSAAAALRRFPSRTTALTPVRDGKPGVVAPAVLLAVALAWQTSVSVYPGAYAVVAVVVVALVRRRDLGRRGAIALAAAVGGFAVFLAVFAVPYVQVLREGRSFVGSRAEVATLGSDFAAVEHQNLVWGSVLHQGRLTPAFPGAVLLVLAVAGVAGWRRHDERVRRAVVLGAVLLVAGAVLATGTAATGWRAWTPDRLLFDHLPGFRVVRAANRAWILGLLGLGLLAGAGLDLARAWPLHRWPIARKTRVGVAGGVAIALAVVAVVGEGIAPWTDRPRLRPSPADLALAHLPEPGGVAYFPMLLRAGEPGEVGAAFGQAIDVFGTTAHHRLTPNGYSGIIPTEFRDRSERLRALPAPAAVDELRRLGVRFVVVRRYAAGGPWDRLLDPATAAPLTLVGRYGGDVVYRLP